VKEKRLAEEAERETWTQKQAGIRETQIAKEQRAAAREKEDPVEQVKRRQAELHLRIGEGYTPKTEDRAFLDEVAKADPLRALRAELIRGVVDIAGTQEERKETLREELKTDPDVEGWHEVEPKTEQEREYADRGLLIVENEEGERAAYNGRE
jgi:hypothetical protein